jgi:uncharacterized Zn-binding protein involved in type VI secretion
MGQPAARQGDSVVGVDIHIVMVPAPPAPPVPTPLPHPFSGTLEQSLSSTVTIDGKAAATKDSVAVNNPPHFPTPPGVSFQKPPDNKGPVIAGSATVTIDGKAAARLGDSVQSCDGMSAIVSGSATVMIG